MICKDELSLYIDIQLSYINTNHEDFIGFANASQKSAATQSAQSSSDVARKAVNQVIRKGFLGVHTGGGIMKRHIDCWFVLTTESLSWYRDEEENDKKYMIQLDQLKIRDIESGLFSRKHLFALFSADGRNIFKEHRQLDLSCDSLEEVENWKASFLRAGVYPEKEVKLPTEKDEISTSDPHLERSVETIRNLVDSYMKIVTKSTRDFVPKIIMHMIINSLKDFIKHEIIAHIYSSGDQAGLMEESAEETQRRNDLLKIYNSSREAVRIIDEVARDKMDNFASSLVRLQPELITAAAAPPPVIRRPNGVQQLQQELYPNIEPLKPTRPTNTNYNNINNSNNTNLMQMLQPTILSNINQQQQNKFNQNGVNNNNNNTNNKFQIPVRVLPNQPPPAIPKRPSATSTNGFKPSNE
jgi:hypothetical protein